MPFINNKKWGYIPSGTDTLNNSNPLLIAWLNKLRLSIFLKPIIIFINLITPI